MKICAFLNIPCFSIKSIIFGLLFFGSGFNNLQAEDLAYYGYSIEDFNTLNLGQPWDELKETEIVNRCGLEGVRNRCLRVKHVPSNTGSPWLKKQIEIPQSEHAILSYDVLFENDFEFVKGGKLPGLASQVPATGCRSILPDSWSARPMWRPEGQLQGYYYGQDRSRKCGEGDTGADFLFKKNTWYNIKVNVHLNTPAHEYGGHMIVSVDNKVIAANYDLRLRANYDDSSLISVLYFDSFFGGNDPSWAPTKPVFARYDNLYLKVLQTDEQVAKNDAGFLQPKTLAKPSKPNPPVFSFKQITPSMRPTDLLKNSIDSLSQGFVGSKDWANTWDNTIRMAGFSDNRVFVDDTIGTDDSPKSLRILYPQGAKTRDDNGFRWEVGLDSPESSVCLSYSMKFEHDFELIADGILPGVGHQGGAAQDDWYAKVAWKKDGRLVVGVRDERGYRQLALPLNQQAAQLTPGRWQSIRSCFIVSEEGANDVIKVWIDGQPATTLSRLKLARDANSSGEINRLMLGQYFILYEDKQLSKDSYIWLNNLRANNKMPSKL